MLSNSRNVRIQWGDCDPMGIVFFPRYFAIFDDSTSMLFERALGMTKFELMQRQRFSGFPLVDIRARFLIPSRFGDDVVVESAVSEFRRSSFDVQHRLLKAGALAVECLETRVWTFTDANGRIKGVPIPEEIRAKFA
ncbi:MAG TPA: thioesterase family protein [Xanthobacteraceae bacterium]